MKKKRPMKKSGDEDRGPGHVASLIADLHPEVKKTVVAIGLFLLSGLFVLSYTGKGGVAGNAMYRSFDFLLGHGYFFAPVVFAGVGLSLFWSRDRKTLGISMAGGFLCLLSTLAAFHILFGSGSGGIVGKAIGGPLLSLFDFWASALIAGTLFAVSLLLILNVPFWRKTPAPEGEVPDGEGERAEGGEGKIAAMLEQLNVKLQSAFEKKEGGGTNPMAEQSLAPTMASVPSGDDPILAKDDSLISFRKAMRASRYVKPPLELLQGDTGKPTSGDIKANSNIIKRTLQNFGIMVEMAEVHIGPTVTQYTLRPAEGVKLSRIIALHNDLSLALAAHPIRIEAPIPGRSLAGIEVPNRSAARVGLRALLEDTLFSQNTQSLLFALGRDVAGSPVFADLARMPHLLISGATGSGKSVAIHSLMMSLLYRNPPELLRFILVDPKRVELSSYNDVPHLLRPVITDAKTVIQTLRWATKEMDRRYDLLSAARARDIAGYNATISLKRRSEKKGESPADEDAEAPSSSNEKSLLPYVVIIIDELADLMATFPREVESSIIRLAQMARAVGIHLIVATQRPSVEVITGLIKANITSRIALQVASQIDSRTILDMAGAEKLLGNGDMLFLAGDTARPRRIQGAFVSEQEVKRVVEFLHEEAGEPVYDDEAFVRELGEEEREEAADVEDDDPLYDEARGLVVEAQKASASYLQRRLRVGYARAARLIDLMEQNGIVGPADGAKPREILVRPGDDQAQMREG